MTARVDLPEGVDRAIAGSNAGKRTLRAIADGQAQQDRLLHDLMEVVEVDGRQLAPSPGLRAYCRGIQKTLEARR